MLDDLEGILLTEEEIKAKVEELGAQISADYQDKNLLLISVLKGSVVFMADLMRAIKIPMRIDFMAVSSYGDRAESSGAVKILKDLDAPLENFDLLIVEDVLDSGRTVAYLREMLLGRKPKSIRICTLLDKTERREVPVEVDYLGFQIPDAFVVGYGLDFAQDYRNLPMIGILKPEIYS